ncbi:hypothetical protein BZY94_04410 [Burkholderia territorii]|nr:hypothetical protein BZY94_04410 [Burkholderia territorii]
MAPDQLSDDKIDADASELLAIMARGCDVQARRLVGTTWSVPAESMTILDAFRPQHPIALQFDPRGFNGQRVRDDAPNIIYTLKREVRRALEAAR